jgi:hypothetical protein
MASITKLRQGLANNLNTIPFLRAQPTIPDQITGPVAIVELDHVDHNKAFHAGSVEYYFNILVVVGRVVERSAQNLMDEFASSTGAKSISIAVQSDRTLGGEAYEVNVQSMQNYGSLSVGEIDYLSATFTVVVYAN